MFLQIFLEDPVRHDLLTAVVEHEHGPHVRVDHETAQRTEEQVQVVRRTLLPTLRVGDADYAVYVLVRVGDAVHLELQRPDEPGEPRGNAHQYYVVARPYAPARTAPVAHKRARLVVEGNLLAGTEMLLVEDVGLELGVAEVRLFGQVQTSIAIPSRDASSALIRGPFRILVFAASGRNLEALAQDAQDLLVARVVSGRDVPDSTPEAEAPGQQVLPFCYGLDGEAVAFEDRVSHGKLGASVGHPRPRLEPARRYRHVVARRGEASDILEIPCSFFHSGASLFSSRDECIAACSTARDGNWQDAYRGVSEAR